MQPEPVYTQPGGVFSMLAGGWGVGENLWLVAATLQRQLLGPA